MAFPIASRRSVSFPRGTRVTYVTRDVCLLTVFAKFVQKARFESKHVTQGLKKPNFYNVVNNPAVNHCVLLCNI